MVKLRPLADRVVVKSLEEEEKTTGGIILPDTAQEKPQKGEVIATGPGKIAENGTRLPLEVKDGDTVVFAKYAGSEVKVDDVEVLILKENDILAILH